MQVSPLRSGTSNSSCAWKRPLSLTETGVSDFSGGDSVGLRDTAEPRMPWTEIASPQYRQAAQRYASDNGHGRGQPIRGAWWARFFIGPRRGLPVAAVAEGLPTLLDHARLPLALGAGRELERDDGRAGGEMVGDARAHSATPHGASGPAPTDLACAGR